MRTILLVVLFSSSVNAFDIPCSDTTNREQWVSVLEGIDGHAIWKVDPNEIHSVSLQNGFELGVKINPVTDDHYRKILQRLDDHVAVPEVVEITLYDMTESPPKRLTHTYGGSNSIQGYSSIGGADTVEELGVKGVKFFLQKTNCISVEDLTNE